MSSRAIFSAGLAFLLGLPVDVVPSRAEPTVRQQTAGQPSGEQAALTAPPATVAPTRNLAGGDNSSSADGDLQIAPGRGNPLWALPLATLSATAERPIFSPSRRRPAIVAFAPAPASQPPSTSQSQRPALSLVGAIAGDADGIAIFLDEATKGVIRLKTGETHAGWTLHSVTGRSAVLQRGRDTAMVVLSNPAK